MGLNPLKLYIMKLYIMSILVSQGINTLLFICRDHEVNVVDMYDNFLLVHWYNLKYIIMIVLRYIGPPLTNQTIVQDFTHDNELFPGS